MMDAEDYAEINARLLGALKALHAIFDYDTCVCSEDKTPAAALSEARAAIDDTETRIANDIAEDAKYAAELAANRARQMAEYAEQVRLGALENQKREAAALASIGRKPNGEPM
jgi:serine phosphatase RsbU (regulator of sigma subunit)